MENSYILLVFGVFFVATIAVLSLNPLFRRKNKGEDTRETPLNQSDAIMVQFLLEALTSWEVTNIYSGTTISTLRLGRENKAILVLYNSDTNNRPYVAAEFKKNYDMICEVKLEDYHASRVRIHVVERLEAERTKQIMEYVGKDSAKNILNG